MKKTAIVSALITLWLYASGSWTHPAGAQTTSPATADVPTLVIWVGHLVQEVAKLRQELHRVQVELQESRITLLERELEQSAVYRLKREKEKTVVQQDIRELDEQLSQPLDSQMYGKLMNTRTALAANLEKLNSEQQTIAGR